MIVLGSVPTVQLTASLGLHFHETRSPYRKYVENSRSMAGTLHNAVSSIEQ